MQPVVSVIVPVYKVEDCLSRCLDSLCRQSLKNIEILLIDDASPDRSSKICEHYAARDARFKVLYHTENKGLSEARNTGIAKATSNYLMFVDSDDWVHEDFCKDAYECAVNYGVDLVMFRHARIAMPIFFPCNTRIEHTMQSGYKTRMEAMDILLNITNHNVWNKLYRKELFFNIFFPPGCLYEDVGTTYKTVWRASRIYFLDKTLYYHCYHAGSITTIKTEKSFHDWFEMHMQRYHDLASWGYPLEKLNELLLNLALSYCIKKKTDITNIQYLFFANALRTAKKIPDNVVWQKKLLFKLFNYCPSIFELVCILTNKKW